MNDKKSLLMLASSLVIYGTIGIFRRYIPLSSGVLACARGVIGALFLLGLLAVRKRPFDRASVGTRWLPLLVSGALIGFNWIFLFEAYRCTTVATATLCYYMQPVIVVLVSPLLFREHLPPRKIVCVAVALLGMVFVSGVTEGGLPAGGEAKGILYGLAAAALYASVVLLNKTIQGVGTYEKTILQLAAAAVVLVPYLAVTEDFSALALTPFAVAMVLVVGVVHTGIAYGLYFGSMDGLRAQTVALMSYIDPVTAILLSALLLHEPMTPLGILGAALVLGSTIVSEVWVPKGKRTTE